jgi:hypothetical protein
LSYVVKPSSKWRKNRMKDWIALVLTFAFGFAAGVVFASVFFESRVRVYKNFIEHRLASINRLYSQEITTHRLPKTSFWRVVFNRRSKSAEETKPTQKK